MRSRPSPASTAPTISRWAPRGEPIGGTPRGPSPASTAPTISRWAPRGEGSDSGAGIGPPALTNGSRVDGRLRACATATATHDLRLYSGLMRLQHFLARLAGADPDRILDREDEDLPVPDRARAGVLQDRLGDDRHVHVVDHALQLQLRPEMNRDRRAAVVLGDSLLAARALHLGDRDAREAALEQLLANRLERLMSDVRDNHLHAVTPSLFAGTPVAARTGAASGL